MGTTLCSQAAQASQYTKVGEGCCRPHNGETALGKAKAQKDLCQAACDASISCMGYDYIDNDKNGATPGCWLMPAAPTWANNAWCNACYAKTMTTMTTVEAADNSANKPAGEPADEAADNPANKPTV